MIQALAFYLFAIVVLVSGVMTIASRNPVHSVLWLILAFFNAAGLFLVIGAEFIAMILVIVYVGAVAVLFLFVVMMLDIDTSRLREGWVKYMPVGVIVAVISCHKGLDTRGGPAGVANSVNAAVVESVLLMMIVNVVMFVIERAAQIMVLQQREVDRRCPPSRNHACGARSPGRAVRW